MGQERSLLGRKNRERERELRELRELLVQGLRLSVSTQTPEAHNVLIYLVRLYLQNLEDYNAS